MSQGPAAGPIHRSAEFRVAVAALVATGALALAALNVLAERTHVLMLDFREWRLAAAFRSRGQVELFDSLQTASPEQRPFRLTLAVGVPGAESGMGVTREFVVAAGAEYCFRALATAPGVVGDLSGPLVEVTVNDEIARRIPAIGLRTGGVITLARIRPHRGRLKIGLAVRAAPAPTVTAPSSVHFEYAVLRPCGRGSAPRP